MKRVIFIIVFIFCSIPLFSQSSEELFKKANSAYQNNDYKFAIEAYKQLISEGYTSGEMLYNLGNSYFRTGQFAPAILYWERAKKMIPGDDEIDHNIAIANLRLQDRIERVPKLFILEWWDNIKNLFSLTFYQIFVLLLFVIFAAVSALFFWAKDYFMKKKIFLILVFCGVIFVFFMTAFITKAVEHDNEVYAVVFEKAIKVKNSPDKGAADLYEIHYGLKFEIIDQLNSYFKILLPDGKTGWIEKSGFEII